MRLAAAAVAIATACGSASGPDGSARESRGTSVAEVAANSVEAGRAADAGDDAADAEVEIVAESGGAAVESCCLRPVEPEESDAEEDAATWALQVPEENRERGERPSADSAEALARKLFEAIRAGDPAVGAGAVFPLAAFEMLKDLPDPAAYHRRLVRWFEEDVGTEHERYSGVESLEFDRFQMGRCDWIPIGEEGNLIAYWSCRHNWIYAKSGRIERRYEIRVLINWGSDWYVTHLGPVRR